MVSAHAYMSPRRLRLSALSYRPSVRKKLNMRPQLPPTTYRPPLLSHPRDTTPLPNRTQPAPPQRLTALLSIDFCPQNQFFTARTKVTKLDASHTNTLVGDLAWVGLREESRTGPPRRPSTRAPAASKGWMGAHRRTDRGRGPLRGRAELGGAKAIRCFSRTARAEPQGKQHRRETDWTSVAISL